MKKSWAAICSLAKIFNEAFSLQTSYKELSKRDNQDRKSHKKMIWWRFLVMNTRRISNARSSMSWNERRWSMWSRIDWKKSEKTSQSISKFFFSCVDADADADKKREKRRHFTDFSLNVFESDDSNDETSFIDVSSRKKSRRKSLFSKKKKRQNFIIRKQKKQIKKTRQLNEKIENHEHALLKKWLCDYSKCSNRNHHC
jgi:hypothetical protein